MEDREPTWIQKIQGAKYETPPDPWAKGQQEFAVIQRGWCPMVPLMLQYVCWKVCGTTTAQGIKQRMTNRGNG